MNRLRLVSLLAVLLLLPAAAPAASKPALNACTVLPVAHVAKVIGQPFHIFSRGEIAPLAHGAAMGDGCNYMSAKPLPGAKAPLEVWFVGYVESSPTVARKAYTEWKAFLAKKGPIKSVSGIGDAAYRDTNQALHVLKGKAHFDLGFQIGGVPWKVTPQTDHQERDLATWIAGRL